uniref:Transposase n=1 Tax=Panagrellus redivivus TaxID=6233 RepID=A0A7E4W2A1_PANRE
MRAAQSVARVPSTTGRTSITKLLTAYKMDVGKRQGCLPATSEHGKPIPIPACQPLEKVSLDDPITTIVSGFRAFQPSKTSANIVPTLQCSR